MGESNYTAVAQVITTVILVGGLLWGAVKQLLKRNEQRHQLTQDALTDRIAETRTELTGQITATKTELRDALLDVQSDLEELEGTVKEHHRAIGFLKERTAATEAMVFKRSPITEEADA